jgi:3-oxoacyl-[acyl-carrier protein] reductase
MDLGLKDKVAIGAAAAGRLAEQGAKVVITDIQAKSAKATASALQANKLAAHCIVADITKSTQVERLVAETVHLFGTVHILVNNAGFPRDTYLTHARKGSRRPL